MYAKKDLKLNSCNRIYKDFRQGQHDSDESVRAYGHWLWRNWREADWDEEQPKLSCYHLS